VSLRSLVEPVYERVLAHQCTVVPRHIAIIQDGNRRYARDLGADTATGHRAGADTTERLLSWACDLGIETITLYAFSTENFNRDPDELGELFTLFCEKFMATVSDERVHRYHIRVRMVGDRSLLPSTVLEAVEEAEAATAGYDRFHLNIALAYGGRNEIVSAARRILADAAAGRVRPGEITPALVDESLGDGAAVPPVDLIIRTGSEYRTSNFLPWQANGNECAVYFCAPYWPRFRKIDLLRAIRVYQQRIAASGQPSIRHG
jgi:tritrans,polycis-undecaprenyl-diphosphate synthase [geranylgeranyl-diphosphate specific]